MLLAAKIAVLRRRHRLGHLLPVLGTLVLLLLALTWATSAGKFQPTARGAEELREGRLEP